MVHGAAHGAHSLYLRAHVGLAHIFLFHSALSAHVTGSLVTLLRQLVVFYRHTSSLTAVR